MFMHLLCIYKKLIILSLFKIDTLNFTMSILTIFTCPLKAYVVRLHNLTGICISRPRPFAWPPALALTPNL